MADSYGNWEVIRKLGEGGQGTVYEARSPSRTSRLKDLVRQLEDGFANARATNRDPRLLQDLARAIFDFARPEGPTELGALKVYKLPSEPDLREKAKGRLADEMKALREIEHPSLLRLLEGSHLDVENPFIVTEYHARGTLDKQLKSYAGRALEALEAFRPLVEAVSEVHAKGAVHRDIKPENIFVASDGRLVLGDFGIVLFRDAEGRRTETYERVGSHEWMPPWANTRNRFALEEIKPSFDIYPLGKVLWCMVSGRRFLNLWYFKEGADGSHPANNLEILFPDDQSMPVINDILGKCIVERERDCLPSIGELRGAVEAGIISLRALGRKPDDGRSWPCSVCRKGYYIDERDNKKIERLRGDLQHFRDPHGNNAELKVWVRCCNHCGHVAMFRQ